MITTLFYYYSVITLIIITLFYSSVALSSKMKCCKPVMIQGLNLYKLKLHPQ